MIETITRSEKAVAPAKQWKNRWAARRWVTCRCSVCGALDEFAPGQTYENHCLTYPSKDVAETAAFDPEQTGDWNRYLGAFPVTA